MALHKIVNGEKIDLTPEEEKATLAEWEANRIKREKRLLEEEALKAKKEEVKQKISSTLNMPVEELNLIFKS